MALTKVTTGVVDDSVFAANKNVIINGNFDIWQRGTTFTSISSGYSADRFTWAQSGSGIVDILQSTSVPDNTSDFSLQIDVTTADSSIAAGDVYNLRYRIEGYDAMRFAFGTSDAKQLTLSFYVKSTKTGIHCVAFRNSASDRSYIVEYTVNVADTWEFKTITLTADITGTWVTDSGIGLRISWALAVGTDRHGIADTWQAGNFFSTSNQVNVMDSTANNFHLSRVQVELGSTATSFERRSFAQELSMAQRYYWRETLAANNVFVNTYNNSTTIARGRLTYPVTMRTSPTISASAAGTFVIQSGSNFAVTSIGTVNTRPESAFMTIGATGLTLGQGSALIFSSSTAFIEADAEL